MKVPPRTLECASFVTIYWRLENRGVLSIWGAREILFSSLTFDASSIISIVSGQGIFERRSSMAFLWNHCHWKARRQSVTLSDFSKVSLFRCSKMDLTDHLNGMTFCQFFALKIWRIWFLFSEHHKKFIKVVLSFYLNIVGSEHIHPDKKLFIFGWFWSWTFFFFFF